MGVFVAGLTLLALVSGMRQGDGGGRRNGFWDGVGRFFGVTTTQAAPTAGEQPDAEEPSPGPDELEE